MTKGYLEWMSGLRAWNAAVSDHSGEWRLDGGCRWDPEEAARHLMASVDRVTGVYVSILGGADLGTLDHTGRWTPAEEVRGAIVRWGDTGWQMIWGQYGGTEERESDAETAIEACIELRQLIGPDPREIRIFGPGGSVTEWTGLISSSLEPRGAQ